MVGILFLMWAKAELTPVTQTQRKRKVPNRRHVDTEDKRTFDARGDYRYCYLSQRCTGVASERHSVQLIAGLLEERATVYYYLIQPANKSRTATPSLLHT